MMVDCDEGMIVQLLRNWRPNRLRPQGFRLARERPRLIAMQNDLCPLCSKRLTDGGEATHIDHRETVKVFADKIISGELTFDDAYSRLWDVSNLRATHREWNYARERMTPVEGGDLAGKILGGAAKK